MQTYDIILFKLHIHFSKKVVTEWIIIMLKLIIKYFIQFQIMKELENQRMILLQERMKNLFLQKRGMVGMVIKDGSK